MRPFRLAIFLLLLLFFDLVSLAFFEQPIFYAARAGYLFLMFAYPPSFMYLLGFSTACCSTLVYSGVLVGEVVGMLTVLFCAQYLKKILNVTPVLCAIITLCLLFIDVLVIGGGFWAWTGSKIIANIIIVFGIMRYMS